MKLFLVLHIGFLLLSEYAYLSSWCMCGYFTISAPAAGCWAALLLALLLASVVAGVRVFRGQAKKYGVDAALGLVICYFLLTFELNVKEVNHICRFASHACHDDDYLQLRYEWPYTDNMPEDWLMERACSPEVRVKAVEAKSGAGKPVDTAAASGADNAAAERSQGLD